MGFRQLDCAGEIPHQRDVGQDLGRTAADIKVYEDWKSLYKDQPGRLVALRDIFLALRDLRLDIEYTQQFRNASSREKDNYMSHIVSSLGLQPSWPKIGEVIIKEQAAKRRYWDGGGKDGGIIYPRTPWLNDIREAAISYHMDQKEMAFEILSFVKRKSIRDSQIKRFINNGSFTALAYRLFLDKQSLQKILDDSPNKLAKVGLATIDKIESEWFERPIGINATGGIYGKGNEKANRREDKVVNSILSTRWRLSLKFDDVWWEWKTQGRRKAASMSCKIVAKDILAVCKSTLTVG